MGKLYLKSSIYLIVQPLYTIFRFTPKWGHPMQKEIGQLNKNLTLEKLEEVARKYESDCDAGKDEKEGWPQTSYGMSKLFVNAITKVYGLDSIFRARYRRIRACISE